ITTIPDGVFLHSHCRFGCVLTLAVVTNTDRKLSAFESLPLDIPIDKILEHFSEMAVLNMMGIPFYYLIVLQQLILHFCRLDEPAFNRIVKKWRTTTPAMWIAMLIFFFMEKQSFIGKVLYNVDIAIFHKTAGKRWNILCIFPLTINHVEKRKVFFQK